MDQQYGRNSAIFARVPQQKRMFQPLCRTAVEQKMKLVIRLSRLVSHWFLVPCHLRLMRLLFWSWQEVQKVLQGQQRIIREVVKIRQTWVKSKGREVMPLSQVNSHLFDSTNQLIGTDIAEPELIPWLVMLGIETTIGAEGDNTGLEVVDKAFLAMELELTSCANDPKPLKKLSSLRAITG